TPATRVEERLCCHGILEVAEAIAGVGEQLDEHHADVSGIALRPRRIALRSEIEKKPAEAGVILRQVIDDRLLEQLRRTVFNGKAIEGRRTTRTEVKVDRGELHVEIQAVDREVIRREVTGSGEIDFELIRRRP